jgi:hypothetical protein
MWTLILPHNEGRTPTHGYEATRDAAMTAFARAGDGDNKCPRDGTQSRVPGRKQFLKFNMRIEATLRLMR